MTNIVTITCVVSFKWYMFKREFTFFFFDQNKKHDNKTKDNVMSSFLHLNSETVQGSSPLKQT